MSPGGEACDPAVAVRALQAALARAGGGPERRAAGGHNFRAPRGLPDSGSEQASTQEMTFWPTEPSMAAPWSPRQRYFALSS